MNEAREHADIQAMLDVDKLVHEPARLVIMGILAVVESADFLYLLGETGLTKGNLSSHLSRLEEGGLIEIEKTYKGKTPLTICHLTDAGAASFEGYREKLEKLLAYLNGNI